MSPSPRCSYFGKQPLQRRVLCAAQAQMGWSLTRHVSVCATTPARLLLMLRPIGLARRRHPSFVGRGFIAPPNLWVACSSYRVTATLT